MPPTVCSYIFFFFNFPSFLSSFLPTSIRYLGKNSVHSLSHIQLYDLMNCSTPCCPVHHQVPEFTQASLVVQMVKHLPAMQETQVWFLGWEDPLEKEMTIHSSPLTWKIPWTEEPDRLQSMRSQRVRHDWATSLSFTFMSIELVMPSNHLILCHPLLLPFSIFRSIRVFANKSVLHIRWKKYWSFSFSVSPSYEYSGLISFRMD